MAIELNKEFFENLRNSIESRDAEEAVKLLQDMHPVDIAEFFEEINIDDAKFHFP
ncbi:MAG: hypothetical protein PHP52_15050 [Bacteroidales bacterium]|nr:hypothetical protein [Bacteroidales bacterium]